MITLLGLLLEFANNIVIWVFIVAVLTFVASKFKKSQFRVVWKRTKWIAIIIVLLASIPSSIETVKRLIQSDIQSQKFDDILSSDEKQRFREIIANVVQNPDFLTSNIHSEFWQFMKKGGISNKSQIESIKEIMTGVATKYQRYFWEDARWALKQGRPFKSQQREEYEKHLKQSGLLYDWRIKENEDLIIKISKKTPVIIQGQQVIITEDLIKTTLGNINVSIKRLDKLFTPPEQ